MKRLFRFMNRKFNGLYKEEDYNHLLSRLDRDRNDKLTIEEFCEAFYPSDFITDSMRKNNYKDDF